MDISQVKAKLQQTLTEMTELKETPHNVTEDKINEILEHLKIHRDEFEGLHASSDFHVSQLDGQQVSAVIDAVKYVIDNQKNIQEKVVALQGSELAPILFNALTGLRDTLKNLSDQHKRGERVEGVDKQESL